MLNIAKDFAPPLKMVLPFFLSGVVAFVLAHFFFFGLRVDFFAGDFFVVGIVHLFFVGFVAMVFVGAMVQLIPVILEVPHAYLNFYHTIFYSFSCGVLSLVFGFWLYDFLLISGAIFIVFGIILYLIDLFFTIRKIAKITFLALVVAMAHINLLFGIGCGVALAAALSGGFSIDFDLLLRLHLMFILVGFMLNLVVAISLVLLPMFSLAHGFANRCAKFAFGLFCISPWFILCECDEIALIVLLLAIAFFLTQIFIIYSRRVRRENDVWFKSLIVSFGSLFGSLILFILGMHKEAIFVFGYGFFGFLILGHLYKIVPFLVWFEYFAPLVGKQKVPMLHQMVPKKEANMQFWMSVTGFVLMIFGLVFQVQDIFLAGVSFGMVGALFVCVNMYLMTRKEIEL